MNDTPPDVERLYTALVMARPFQERVEMGAASSRAARTIVLASFPPGLSEKEIRRRLFERFYPEVEVPPPLR